MIHFDEIFGGHETHALGGQLRQAGNPILELKTTQERPAHEGSTERATKSHDLPVLDPSTVALIEEAIGEETLYHSRSGGMQ